MSEAKRQIGTETLNFMESIDYVLRHPAIATLITFLLLVTGGLGSVYSNEIRRAFPLYWGPFDGLSVPAIAFWSMVAVSGTLFFFRQRATDTARERAQREIRTEAKRLLEQNERLETLLRTMPPENFLEQFVELYASAHDALVMALDPDRDDRSEAVKLCVQLHLRIVAYLARKFDGDRQKPRYAANIMLFRRATDLRDEQIAEYEKLLKFCDQSTDCRKLLGLLELVPDFSATDNEPLLPDGQIPRIVLPIPMQAKNPQGRWLALPGAPVAFITGKASAFADTLKLREWLDREGDFQDVVKSEIEQYFAEDSNLRSFVSIPILTAECLYKSDKVSLPPPIGILNIHVDCPGLLRGADWTEAKAAPMSQFNAIIQPFVLNLVKLLTNDTDRVDKRSELQEKPSSASGPSP